MKKLFRTTVVALILAGTLVAFRGPGPRQPTPPAPKNKETPGNNQAPANNRQRIEYDNLGREVDIDSARSCVRLYATLAVKSKLSDREQKLYPNFRRSRVNTTGEVFSSKKLLAWLQETQDLYEKQNLTLHLNVEMGLYTLEYLKIYYPKDEEMQKKLCGRVGIFMIPLDSASKWSIDREGKLSPDPFEKGDAKVAVQHGPSALSGAISEGITDVHFFGGGGKGYDLGGLQP